MFEEELGLYHENMFAIFDQKFCVPSEEVTGKKYGFIRDLNKIWTSSACKDYAKQTNYAFGPENTIMLESEEEQCFNCWRNSLVVDRYEREDVWPTIGSVDDHRNQVSILKSIRNDLFAILDSQKGDVREFLAHNCGNEPKLDIKFGPFLRKARKMKYDGPQEDGNLIEVISDGEVEKENQDELNEKENQQEPGPVVSKDAGLKELTEKVEDLKI